MGSFLFYIIKIKNEEDTFVYNYMYNIFKINNIVIKYSNNKQYKINKK